MFIPSTEDGIFAIKGILRSSGAFKCQNSRQGHAENSENFGSKAPKGCRAEFTGRHAMQKHEHKAKAAEKG